MCRKDCCPASGGRSGLVLVAVVLAVIVAERHAIGRFLGEVIHVAMLAGLSLLVLAAVVVLAVLAVKVRRAGWKRRVPTFALHLPRWLRNLPRALWAAARWHHFTRNAGLAKADKHAKDAGRSKVLRPRARIWPTAHGVSARVRTTAVAGRAEFEQAADLLAGHWRSERVGVSQVRPGRLLIRGLVRDPLLAPFTMADAPPGAYRGADLTRLYVGRDEFGQDRWLVVKNNTAATVAGVPGSGKSNGINGLLLQWAPSPACQFGTADGKAPADAGDYEPWRPRAWRSIGDNREACADMLSDACAVMRERLGRVVELTGHRNAWHVGPTPDFPLFGLVLDEAQRFLDASVAKRDKDLERLICHIQTMVGDITRQGRSVLMFLVLATQRATVDSIPGQIRDNAALSLALAQKTMNASVAALGDDIRDYPTFAPTTLQGPEYVGCAIATMRTGADPFTRLKFPEVATRQLEQAAAETAHLRRDPRALLPVVVPDDASELVP